MPQYRYAVYNFGQFPDEQQAKLDEMCADGWRVSTAIPNFSELSVLWVKDGLPGQDGPPARGQDASEDYEPEHAGPAPEPPPGD